MDIFEHIHLRIIFSSFIFYLNVSYTMIIVHMGMEINRMREETRRGEKKHAYSTEAIK